MPERAEQEKDAHNPPFPVVIVGTRAQLIKVAPVLRELERRHLDYRLVFTGQHRVTMRELLDEFGVKQAPAWLGRKREIDTVAKMLPWFLGTLWRLAASRRELLKAPDGRSGLIVVHGDTVSTLLGALAGRLNRHRVAHIESGLRSFDWRDPFPEELTRVVVFRLINLAFCPGAWATENMKHYRVESVDTGANTLLDAVRFALDSGHSPEIETPDRPYCVVSIHRFENFRSSNRLDAILAMIRDVAGSYDVEFVLHPSTRAKLTSTGRLADLEAIPTIHLRDRMGYTPFLRLMANAAFVLTDGGSNQEELSYLERPTLILRDRSERKEGLESNAALVPVNADSDWRKIFEELRAKSHDGKRTSEIRSPSSVIVDFLAQSPTLGSSGAP